MSHTLKPLFTWRSAIADKDSGLTPAQRHVALTLSLHMSDKGDSCFPASRTVAEETGLARSTVIEALRALVAKGFLTAGKRGGGRGLVNEYRTVIPQQVIDVIAAREDWKTVRPSDPSSEGLKTVRPSDPSTGNGPMDDEKRSDRPTGNGPPIGPEDVDLEDVDLEDGEPPKNPAGSPPADWTGFEDIRTLLGSLRWRHRTLLETDLDDPDYWRDVIDSATTNTRIFYDDELRTYAGWLNTREPSFRRTNHRRGFRNWIEKSKSRETWADERERSKRAKTR